MIINSAADFNFSTNRSSTGRAGRMSCPGVTDTAYELVHKRELIPAFIAAITPLIEQAKADKDSALRKFSFNSNRINSARYSRAMTKQMTLEHALKIVTDKSYFTK